MPRPTLPVGTWGKIRRRQYGPGRWQARARFHDYDGHTRDVEAWAATGAAAGGVLLAAASQLPAVLAVPSVRRRPEWSASVPDHAVRVPGLALG